jgi:transcriptional regulator with XRE-family HTH domain
MGAIHETLRRDLLQPEFSEGYAESFQDALVATQIKVLREQNHWTQSDLAAAIGTTQTAISRIENVNYSSWSISTLKKLARAFRVRLKVSFETYGSLIRDVENFNRESLQRTPREFDPELMRAEPSPVTLIDIPGRLGAKSANNVVAFPSAVQTGNRTGPGRPSAQEKGLITGGNSTETMPPRSAMNQAFIEREATA